MLRPQRREGQNAAWRFWVTVSLFGVASVLGCLLGNKPAFPDWMELSLLLTMKASPLLQSDVYYLTQVWVEKQVVMLGLVKNTYFFSQFERDTRTFIWQGLSLLFLGTCKISVVIPTLNEEKYISSCLGSLEKQSFDGDFEVIVVDGGSSDSTVEIAKAAADKIIIYKRRPVGDARNLGAKLAEADTVAFIDADTLASTGWLNSISESLSLSEVVGVTGPTLPYEGSELDVLAYKVATGWLQRFSMVFGLPHVAGFNCAYRREAFLRCGGFEEGRTLSEDLALSLKMRHEGQLLFNRNMVAYTSPRRVRNYGYVRLAMFYLLNDAIFALTGRSLYYPPVR